MVLVKVLLEGETDVTRMALPDNWPVSELRGIISEKLGLSSEYANERFLYFEENDVTQFRLAEDKNLSEQGFTRAMTKKGQVLIFRRPRDDDITNSNNNDIAVSPRSEQENGGDITDVEERRFHADIELAEMKQLAIVDEAQSADESEAPITQAVVLSPVSEQPLAFNTPASTANSELQPLSDYETDHVESLPTESSKPKLFTSVNNKPSTSSTNPEIVVTSPLSASQLSSEAFSSGRPVNAPRALDVIDDTTLPQCDECAHTVAIVHCKTCDAVFCQTCLNATHASKVLKNHQAVVLSRGNPRNKSARCLEHPTEIIRFLCLDDRGLLCRDCLLIGNHRGHKYCALEEASHEIREGLRDLCRKARAKEVEWSQIASRVHIIVPDLESHKQDVVVRINARFDYLRDMLEKRRNILLEEAVDMATRRSVRLHQEQERIDAVLDRIRVGCAASEHIVDTADAVEIMRRRKELETNLRGVIEAQYHADFLEDWEIHCDLEDNGVEESVGMFGSVDFIRRGFLPRGNSGRTSPKRKSTGSNRTPTQPSHAVQVEFDDSFPHVVGIAPVWATDNTIPIVASGLDSHMDDPNSKKGNVTNKSSKIKPVTPMRGNFTRHTESNRSHVHAHALQAAK